MLRFLYILLPTSDGNDITVTDLRWQVDFCVGFIADFADGVATFADHVLVELLEDVNVRLVVGDNLRQNVKICTVYPDM